MVLCFLATGLLALLSWKLYGKFSVFLTKRAAGLTVAGQTTTCVSSVTALDGRTVDLNQVNASQVMDKVNTSPGVLEASFFRHEKAIVVGVLCIVVGMLIMILSPLYICCFQETESKDEERKQIEEQESMSEQELIKVLKEKLEKREAQREAILRGEDPTEVLKAVPSEVVPADDIEIGDAKAAADGEEELKDKDKADAGADKDTGSNEEQDSSSKTKQGDQKEEEDPSPEPSMIVKLIDEYLPEEWNLAEKCRQTPLQRLEASQDIVLPTDRETEGLRLYRKALPPMPRLTQIAFCPSHETEANRKD